MATVTDKTTEFLVGHSTEPQLSQQSRATFLKYARKDEDSSESYMDEQDFVNAIAPEGESYVS